MARLIPYPVPVPQLRQELQAEVDRLIATRYNVPQTRVWQWRMRLGVDAFGSLRASDRRHLMPSLLAQLAEAGASGAYEASLARVLGCTRENVRQGLVRLERRSLVAQDTTSTWVRTPAGMRAVRQWVLVSNNHREGA